MYSTLRGFDHLPTFSLPKQHTTNCSGWRTFNNQNGVFDRAAASRRKSGRSRASSRRRDKYQEHILIKELWVPAFVGSYLGGVAANIKAIERGSGGAEIQKNRPNTKSPDVRRFTIYGNRQQVFLAKEIIDAWKANMRERFLIVQEERLQEVIAHTQALRQKHRVCILARKFRTPKEEKAKGLGWRNIKTQHNLVILGTARPVGIPIDAAIDACCDEINRVVAYGSRKCMDCRQMSTRGRLDTNDAQWYCNRCWDHYNNPVPVQCPVAPAVVPVPVMPIQTAPLQRTVLQDPKEDAEKIIDVVGDEEETEEQQAGFMSDTTASDRPMDTTLSPVQSRTPSVNGHSPASTGSPHRHNPELKGQFAAGYSYQGATPGGPDQAPVTPQPAPQQQGDYKTPMKYVQQQHGVVQEAQPAMLPIFFHPYYNTIPVVDIWGRPVLSAQYPHGKFIQPY